MSFTPAAALVLTPIDLATIGAYFGFCIFIGIFLKRRAERKGLDSYVVADRNLPWWLIGTSMVAATFAADTPLLVSNWVYQSGISNNWEWWCFLPGAMLTTFLFAGLWRRTEVLTDAEYVTLRYSGAGAHFLRGYRALYMGFVMNTIVIGSQFVVSGKFGTTLMGVEEGDANYHFWRIAIALVCGLVAMFYSSLAGIAGIVVNDFVQFTLAMLGAILVAYFALAQPEVGGLGGLVTKLAANHPEKINFLPPPGDWSGPKLALQTVVLFLTVRWWAQVYGGAEPGGASHVAQRMLSARSEKHALFGTLWFNVAHYAVRPWPWILTGLACLFIFPGAPDAERAYIKCIGFIPAGLKGLVLAGFFSALMAIDTRLNMGSAYFVNDLYRPYLARDRSDRHYVMVARGVIVVQMALALLMFRWVTKVESAFFITLAVGSGTGMVLLLRWYWWRVSAWSEIAAMTAALINALTFRFWIYPTEKLFKQHALQVQLTALVVVTIVWVVVTLVLRPPDVHQLKRFYRKVRPAGPFWAPVARAVIEEDGVAVTPGYRVGRSLLCWIVATLLVYSILFGTGKLLLGSSPLGWGLISAAGVLLAALILLMRNQEKAPP